MTMIVAHKLISLALLADHCLSLVSIYVSSWLKVLLNLIFCLCPVPILYPIIFEVLYLEEHIRGRSVLGELLQTGVHKIAEII